MQRRRAWTVAGPAAVMAAAGMLISGCTAPADSTGSGGTASGPSSSVGAPESPSSTAPSHSETAAPTEPVPEVPTEPSEGAVAYATLIDEQMHLHLEDTVTPGQSYAVHLVCDTGTLEYAVSAPDDDPDDDVIAKGKVSCPADVLNSAFVVPTFSDGIKLPNDGGFQVGISEVDGTKNALVEIVPEPDTED